MRLACEAFAKVNRSLVVVGKRPDGFHELDTVFETIDLADTLTFEPADALAMTCDDPSLPTDERNLVLRAARALAEKAGVPAGARIALAKRIPHGAGLGGGSSDAAAALMGLTALWGTELGPPALAEIAAGLGSDVPFFLSGGRARGTGRGERIAPLPDAPREWLVLLSPAFPLSTPEVYKRLNAPKLTGSVAATNLSGSDPGACPDRNDLEPAAESLRSEVRLLRELLLGAGARSARLSGSGSTVFGVFSSEDEARDAARRLSGMPEGTAVRIVSTVGREEFRARATPRLL